MSSALIIKSDLDSRSQMYRLLMQLFQFPNGSLYEGFASGSWQQRLKNAAAEIGYQFIGTDAENIVKAPIKLSAEEYEVEFIALYEVGMGGAPCALHSGHYGRDRMKIMEEVLRFYRYFDYQPDRSADRFPDHLALELGFMTHLSEQVHAAGSSKGKPSSSSLQRSLMLAQRDFVMRNLVSWVPDLAALIKERSHYPFFKQTGSLLRDFVLHDYEYLQQQLLELDLEPANTGARSHE